MRRSYPRALIGALLVAGVAYVLVGVAVSAAVPTDVLAASDGPLLEVVRAAGDVVPADLFSVIALIAVANGALLTSIMASRLLYGMARDGLLPPVLGRVLPRRRTPGVAIAVVAVVSVLLAASGTLTTLASTVVLLLLVVFLSTNVAVLVLRRAPVEHDHVRVPLVLPVLGALSCVVLAVQQAVTGEPVVFAYAGGLLAAGLVLYGLSRLAGADGTAADEVAAQQP